MGPLLFPDERDNIQNMPFKSGALAPGFLIASPPLGDPNFDRTVVLLALHSETGALGFVINRTVKLHLGELLKLAGYGEKALNSNASVYSGGPVQPNSGWIISLDPALSGDEAGVIPVGDRIRVTSSRNAFDTLASDIERLGPSFSDPKHRMVVLGYSGWGPGQLEGEIAAGAWLPVPLSENIVFDVAVTERWERAYALLGLTPSAMMTMRTVGSA